MSVACCNWVVWKHVAWCGLHCCCCLPTSPHVTALQLQARRQKALLTGNFIDLTKDDDEAVGVHIHTLHFRVALSRRHLSVVSDVSGYAPGVNSGALQFRHVPVVHVVTALAHCPLKSIFCCLAPRVACRLLLQWHASKRRRLRRLVLQLRRRWRHGWRPCAHSW